MAAILVFTVLLVASLSRIMVYGQKCGVHMEVCGPRLVKCCKNLVCWSSTINSYVGVCHKLADVASEAGAPNIAQKPLSVIVILTSFWGLYGHLIP